MYDISNQRKIQHLYLRAGFGESISKINKSLNKTVLKIAQELFDDSVQYTDLNLNTELSYYKNQNGLNNFKELSKEEKKNFKKKSKENIKGLNIRWIDKMTFDKAQLREKMTLFWHGHFACRMKDAEFCQNQNNTIRRNALGKFGDILMEVSKDPAMLQFLNNQQNKKFSPNENFAREVMELFTLGRGNYSEKDIKEGARAFTGWGFNKKGEFVFRRGIHDTDDKTFFKKTGNFTGEDIINMILEKKRTAEFIVEKIYKYFVNENVNKEIAAELSRKFYESEYNIEALLKNIFTSEWFYSKENIGVRIKSPIEFIVGLRRSFNIDFLNQSPLLVFQRILGQILFEPPNVAGWAGGRNWIDTSSLVYRLKLPEIIFRASNVDFDYKNKSGMTQKNYEKLSKRELKQGKQLNVKADLSNYIQECSKYEDKELFKKLSEYLLQVNPDFETKSIIADYADNSSTENLIGSLTLRLISLPEYQLC